MKDKRNNSTLKYAGTSEVTAAQTMKMASIDKCVHSPHVNGCRVLSGAQQHIWWSVP